MWNCKVLTPPPYCEIKNLLTSEERDCLLAARKCLKTSTEVIRSHVQILTTEQYVTKRTIYKLSNQFRTDKALQTLRQVNTCMKRFETVNLEKLVSDALQIVDRVPGNEDNEVYLTSRQILEYQLVRLQGTGALLRQLVQYSLKTFIHVKQQLELGNMIPQNLVMLALTSRIWFVCNSLGLYVCRWYGKLYPCLAVHVPTAVTWLQNEELPADLTEWLTEQFADIGFPGHFCTELKSRADAEKTKGTLPASVEFLEATNQEDLGEVVQRTQPVDVPETITKEEAPLIQEDKSNKRKFESDSETSEVNKKQKVTVDNQKSEIDKSHLESNKRKNKKQKQLRTSLNGAKNLEVEATETEVNDKDVGSVKACLESVLNTYNDVDRIAKQIKSGKIQIHSMNWKLTKSGKKKVMKCIDSWKRSVQGRGSLPQTGEFSVKKVMVELSELLVKHGKNNLESENIGKTVAETAQKQTTQMQTTDTEKIPGYSLDQDSVAAVKISDVQSDQINVVKKKKKKKKGRSETRANSYGIAKVGWSVKSIEKSPAQVEKKSKKRKRKR